MLKDRVAVVTGGSRGIGKAICLKLAENGADIAVIYAGNKEKADETVAEIEKMGRKAKAYQCDVADAGAVKTTIKEVVAELGGINILVNNAGITKDRLVPMMKEKDFDAVVDTNLKGAFYMIKQVYPLFLKQKSGKIINISSVSGLMGNAGQANYASSKAGLIGLTKSIAKEVGSRGICCNAIAPGFIVTDMTESFTSNEELKNFIPMKDFGDVDDVAELALFLASEKSKYITGEVIRVDGGMGM